MKKILVIAVALFELSAFGNVFPGVLEKFATKQVTASKSHACTDFSGKWAGKCGADNQDVQFELKQIGCAFLDSGDQISPIGGYQDMTLAIPRGEEVKEAIAISASSNLNWNQDKTVLLTQGTLNIRPLHQDASATKIDLVGEMRLDGDKLTNTFKVQEETVSCVFTRQ